MAKKPAETPAQARIECLRAAGITEFEGEIPGWGHVKLKLGAVAAAPSPVTGTIVGPAPKQAAPEVPPDLAKAGVKPEDYRAVMERANELSS
jgi:hypothetical protein